MTSGKQPALSTLPMGPRDICSKTLFLKALSKDILSCSSAYMSGLTPNLLIDDQLSIVKQALSCCMFLAHKATSVRLFYALHMAA